MLSKDQFSKYSELLDKILQFKPSQVEMHLDPPVSGPITNSKKLFDFLGLSTKNEELIKKCNQVYNIINPSAPLPAPLPPPPPAS